MRTRKERPTGQERTAISQWLTSRGVPAAAIPGILGSASKQTRGDLASAVVAVLKTLPRRARL